MNEIIRTDSMPVHEVNNIRTPDTIATEINLIVQKTKEVVLSAAIEIGKRLVEAKELVKHGEWEQWLQDNVNYSQSTANNLMAVYREFGSDQQSLFDRMNNQTIENLSYSKAVALLVLPREQREEFLEQNPVEDMSTRELQAAIKRAQEAEEQLDTAIEERQKYQKLAGDEMARADKLTSENNALNIKVRGMEQRLDSAKKVVDELERTKEAKKKADAKVEKMKNQIKALEAKQNQPDQQTLDRLSAEAEEKAKAANQRELDKLQAQLEEAQKEKEQITKRLATMGSKEMIQAKLLVQQIQDSFNRLYGLIALLSNKGDIENSNKLKNVIRNLCKKIPENLEG